MNPKAHLSCSLKLRVHHQQILLYPKHFIPLLVLNKVWLFPESLFLHSPLKQWMVSFPHSSYHSLDLEVEEWPPFPSLPLPGHFLTILFQKFQPTKSVNHQTVPITTFLWLNSTNLSITSFGSFIRNVSTWLTVFFSHHFSYYFNIHFRI